MNDAEKEGPCQEADGCPTELAVLQRFWRNTSQTLAAQKEAVKGRDSDWWRGYSAALHWISVEAFTARSTKP